MIELIRQAQKHSDSIAVLAAGAKYTYRELLSRSGEIAGYLLTRRPDLAEARVAFMVAPGFNYVATLWGIWRAGGVAVPICLGHPLPSITHVVEDTGSKVVIASPEFESVLQPLCDERRLHLMILGAGESSSAVLFPDIPEDRRALVLYTSGTTNLPKGVVSTHRNLNAQITTLVKAWRWSSTDHILCVLPLHHVHGIVNVVCCSLWVGARCEFLPDFDAKEVFNAFLRGAVDVFMAVPTIYYKLIAEWETLLPAEQANISSALASFRLMVSGSAALPVSVMEKWKKISNHTLLERYGMTELGMAISNPYHGERRAGSVGKPLEGISVRLCDEEDKPVRNEAGEIQVNGDNVFLEYWNQPEATKKSFTKDGWFKTGDVAVVEDGYYRILGRSSVDIIKSGGYKISALEIEEVLRSHAFIKDCAVVGIENEEWGEVVAAALVLKEGKALNAEVLSLWLRERLPSYRVPRKFLTVNDLPRNPMGKVVKSEVKKLFLT